MKTCSTCGTAFTPAFVYQMAATPERQQVHFCTLECRRRGLGSESLRTRARRLAVLNHATGTGKTTTAVNLAAAMAERGQRVLLVDVDPDGNLGATLGIRGERSLYHVLVHDLDAGDAAVPVGRALDVITGGATLAVAEDWLTAQELGERARTLTGRLNSSQISRRYDLVLLDCGAEVDLLTLNALGYVDEVLAPIACDTHALDAIRQVIQTLSYAEQRLHHSIRSLQVLPTFFDPLSRVSGAAVTALQAELPERCLSPIRVDGALPEAAQRMKSIFEHAPASDGACDYARALATLLGRTSERPVDAADHVAA